MMVSDAALAWYERRPLHLLLLVAVVPALFGITLLNGFVWDDQHFIVGNEFLKNADFRYILTPLSNGVEYFPVRDLSLALDFAVWGENPLGFHLTNLLLYCFNVIAAYYLFSRLMMLVNPRAAVSADLTACVAALLFVVHPIHGEVVYAVFNRGALMSGLFCILSCYLFLRFMQAEAGKYRWYTGALLSYLAALLSKQYGIILPLILILFLIYDERKRSLRSLVTTVPFFVLSILSYILFRAIAVRAAVIPEAGEGVLAGVSAKLAVASQIVLFYLTKLVVPYPLEADYSTVFSPHIASLPAIVSLVVCVLLAFLTVMARRRYPFLLFCYLFFLAGLIPMLNLFKTAPVVADRYAYIPSLAFALAVAIVLTRIPWRSAVVVLICVLAPWSAISFQRATVWKSEQSLWEDAIVRSPSLKAYQNLGIEYYDRKNYTKAGEMFMVARRLNPNDEYYDFLQGRIALERYGDIAGATAWFLAGLERNPKSRLLLIELATCYEIKGNMEGALEAYRRVLDVRSYDAMASWRTKALRRLAALSFSLERFDDALAYYRQLTASGFTSWDSLSDMASIHHRKGNLREAASYFEQSIRLKRSNPNTYNSLGLVYRDMKQYDKAVGAFSRAMSLDGSYEAAPLNLAETYREMGDKAQADKYFAVVRERFSGLREHGDKVRSNGHQ